jgi:Bacterial SH3 domain
MLGNLFKKPEDDEKRQMLEGMQSMSEQIGALSKQLADKNAEIEQLQQATSGAAANATTLDAAKKEMAALQQQIHELQRKLAEEQAAHEADEMANELIRKQQAKAQAKATAASAPGAPGLAVGGSAWVTRAGGLPLRLRSGAGLGHDVLDRLPPGTQMTLLDGPQQADNYAWWHIRTADGREGWVAGQDLRAQPD